jgi:cytochrome c2
MNRQVLYITYAHLLLAIVAGSFIFIQKISSTSFSSDIPEENFCGTEIPAVSLTPIALAGKTLFISKCQTCHFPGKKMTGPDLLGFTSRGPWTNRENVYAWIRNPQSFMEKNDYVKNLVTEYFGTMMTPFPSLKDDEIDQIVAYLEAL